MTCGRPALALAALVAALLLLNGNARAADSGNPETQTAQAPASDADATMSADEIAKRTAALIKASQNPVGNIAIIPFQTNFNNGVGANSLGQFNENIQPVVPIMLSPSLNLIARTIVPLINNPSNAPQAVCNAAGGCGSTFGIGDIQEQLFLAPKTKPDALIWGAGTQLNFPSGTPAQLTSGKFSAGPAVVALIMPGAYVIGVLATQVWSYAGTGMTPPVSTLFVQPFVNYNFGKGWTLGTGPGITANWNAVPNNRWTVPVGGGITKTFKLGDQPMQLGLVYYWYAVRPAFSAQSQLRLNWNLLFPVKRG
jgi:hypothetical protein